MMTLRYILVVVALWTSVHISAAEIQHMQGLGDTRHHQVESTIIGRGFFVDVSLPDGYEASDRAYPTVYLLDGGNLFPMLVPYYRYLNFGEEIPDAIIIGISYGNDNFEDGNFRSTDYTAPSDEREYWGGANEFQQFLSNELLPFIEGQYRSDANRRVIFGQSIAGQFSLYTALTEPNLFWGHIASNPALHRNLPFFLESHGSDEKSDNRSRLFVASGTGDDPTFREPAQAWIAHWKSVDDRPWILRTTDLAGHSHMSAPPAAFRQGMTWLFSAE